MTLPLESQSTHVHRPSLLVALALIGDLRYHHQRQQQQRRELVAVGWLVGIAPERSAVVVFAVGVDSAVAVVAAVVVAVVVANPVALAAVAAVAVVAN